MARLEGSYLNVIPSTRWEYTCYFGTLDSAVGPSCPPPPTLRDVHFLQILSRVHLSGLEVLDERRRQACLLCLVPQSYRAVYPPIRQEEQVVFHVALGVVSVRHIPRQFIELRGADWADAVAEGRRAVSLVGRDRVTGWCFKSGQAR